jgi:hypothetical protein
MVDEKKKIRVHVIVLYYRYISNLLEFHGQDSQNKYYQIIPPRSLERDQRRQWRIW